MRGFRLRICFALLVFALLLGGGFTLPVMSEETSASGKTSKSKDQAWTVDDVVLAEEASSWTISADGQLAAWSQSRIEKIDEEEKEVSDIWLIELQGGEPRQMTRAASSANGLAFSPDGRHLAFLSRRDFPADKKAPEKGGQQVWAIAVKGGEAFPITHLERGVQTFHWLDEERLLLLAAEVVSAVEQQREDAQDTTQIVDDAFANPPIRLFESDLKGKVKRLTQNKDWIDQVAVAPNREKALITAQQSLTYQFDSRTPPKAFLVDLASGEREPVLDGSNLLVSSPKWALDGSGFYFINSRSNHERYRMATVEELHFYDLPTGQQKRLDLDWPRGLTFGGFEVIDGGVIALLADGVRYRPARFELGTAKRTDLQGTHITNIESWTASANGQQLVYCASSITVPEQCFGARLEGESLVDERQLTKLNPGFADKPTGRFEIIRWRGARDKEVEGILHYPLDWQEGEKYPLVLDIHGGPASADRDRWDLSWAGPNLLWRQRGAFVLQVNYHGSSSYGLEWVESIQGHYYEYPRKDLETGVDHLIELGLVDPDRLASSGWSNGGILTADLITQSDRFKAAIVGAADVEWISDWANVDFGASFDNYYFGGTPWEATQVYIDNSPFFRLTEVTTPTLIHTGTEDRNVPPHQSWSLFRALQYIGEAPTKLALYPGEPHGLRKIAHQRRKLQEDLAWFDHYLFKTSPKGEEARSLPETSRLAGLLEKQKAKTDDKGRYGVVEKGLLIPETVVAEGVKIGRFEVTRAQYAAFSGDKFASLEANLPQTGLKADEVGEYLAWLSRKTGRSWRLPTRAEMEALAGGNGGNTLDHWLGYTANPEDTARVHQRLSELAGEAPLLLTVGSFRPNKVGLFDLDGNAAEWVVETDGGLVAQGPSAERPNDEMSQATPALAYTGFRLVAE